MKLMFNKKKKGKLFVLVLDEFDVLFNDRRGRPSDFIYKLLVMEEKIREKGFFVCVIAISNNVMADYEVDDRVRSRIGSSEVFFNGYSKQDVLKILQDRARKAFNNTIDPAVLEYCARSSSQEHGDARRAIDLLRVSAEIAGSKGEQVITTKHVDMALEQLQKDRIATILSDASYHLKLSSAALARITYLTEEEWHSTSTLYKQYCKIIAKDTKPLTYRRVSELLVELENTGLVVSQTSSKGRHGYGTQYKLTVSPETVGNICFPDWWKSLVQKKKEHERQQIDQRIDKKRRKSLFGGREEMFGGLREVVEQQSREEWKDFVGLEK